MSRRLPYDRTVILILLALLSFGLAMVFSASGIVSMRLHDSFTWIFTKQLGFVIAGLVLMVAVMHIDYHVYSKPIFVYSLLFVSAALLAAVFFFPVFNGARRWIVITGFRFQPSEFAKIALIVFTAYYLVKAGERFHSFSTGLLPYLAVVGVNICLILAEPDLGTPICILFTLGFLLFLGGLRYRFILPALALVIPAFYILVLEVPWRRNRVLAFLNPDMDPLGAGYHIRQSLISLGSGGWYGVGYAKGTQKQFFLPEPHNDFIFSVIGEETGLIGTLLLLSLFSLLFFKGVKIALRADSRFGIYLGMGIVAMITFQALINMSVVVSLMPTKGIPLPFISVGGSSMLGMLTAVGILLNISRQGRKEAATGVLLGEVAEADER